jgi:WD40 repeat protein
MLQSVVMVLVANLTQAQALDQYGDPLPTGALMRLGTTRWRHSDHCTLAAFVGDGKSAITAGYDGLVAQWSVPDLSTRKEIRRLVREDSDPSCAIFCKRDKQILAGYSDGAVCLWDATTGECMKSFASGSPVTEILVHPSERSFATVGANTSILIWAMPD